MGENVGRASNELFASFHSTHAMLFVGQTAGKDELSNILSLGEWSAVITTRREADFSALLAKESVHPRECDSRAKIASRQLSRENPPVIRLLGIEGEGDDEPSPLAAFFDEHAMRLNNARDLLRMVPVLMDYVNKLVVTGLGSTEDVELFPSFAELLLSDAKIAPGSVSFWGAGSMFVDRDDCRNALAEICKQKSFGLHEVSLSDVLTYRMEEEKRGTSQEPASPTTADDVFYCNKLPVCISRDKLLRLGGIGCLMTERTVYKVRPYGRIQQRIWFSNFLECIGLSEPPWYGYLSNSDFHVRRDYENVLVQVVRRALGSRNLPGVMLEDKPIVLSGHPGSSKSVTLGALAFRIYKEKIYPVIFVSQNGFVGSTSGGGMGSLVEILEEVREASDSGMPILVVWDSAAYREIEADAKNLLKRLKNKGRNVVLVCSSYSLWSDEKEAACFLMDKDSKIFKTCVYEEAEVLSRSGCVFVRAGRSMSHREMQQFWQSANQYSGIESRQITALRKALEAQGITDIFNHYYALVTLLRSKLEEHLEHEQYAVTRFIHSEWPAYFEDVIDERREERRYSVVARAFLRAGYSESMLKERMVIKVEAPEEIDLSESLVNANTYVALFSRYGLDIPYGAVYQIMMERGRLSVAEEYARRVFDILTTRIPWLVCEENESQEYVIRYRNSLEADIFLRNHHVEGEGLVDIATDMLRLYGEHYERDGFDDPRMALRLQSLVRMLGPNSRYYRQDSVEHQAILVKLDKIIDHIESLLAEYSVPDLDSGFALLLITLTREYYGKNIWGRLHKRPGSETDYHTPGYMPENYESRLDRMERAISLALRSSQALEDNLALHGGHSDAGYLRRQINALSVEATRCYLEAADLRDQYKLCCDAWGQEANLAYTGTTLPYATQFKKISEVIQRDPTNGYAYNAIFSLFEREYQAKGVSEGQRIEMLAQIMVVVKDCEMHEDGIMNRGDHSDELGNHLGNIRSFADKVPVTIDTIVALENGDITDDAGTSAFIDLYQRYLQEGVPTAILLLAHKEVGGVSRDSRELSAHDRRRCEKAMNFMADSTRYACVCKDANALASLVQIAWMAVTGTRLSSTRECQTTSLARDEWEMLYRYCRDYDQVVTTKTCQPIIVLVHALSALQVGNRNHYSYSAAYEILQKVHEEQFGSQYRMRTPFIICEDNGMPVRYSGTVISTKERVGYVRVNGFPRYLGGGVGVRFFLPNLGRHKRMPEVGDVLSNLEMGIGYTGFSLYTERGRDERRRSR